MPNEEKCNPFLHRSYRPTQYLLTNEDAEKIDGMISSLGLAISEIFGRRAIRERYPWEETPAQDDFNAQVQAEIYEAEFVQQKASESK